MSPKVLQGGVILSLLLNLILSALIFQSNSHLAQANERIAAIETDLSRASERTDEAHALVTELKGQVENTGTLTRFAVTAISEQLSQLVTQTITLSVPINEQVPVATSVQLDQTFRVPIQTTVPISTDVAVPLELGIFGEHTIDLPINLTVPIDLVVDVPFREEIPINTTVPIVMDVPVVLSLKDTPLAAQLAEWRETLGQLGVGSGVE